MVGAVTLQIKPVGNNCNIACKYCYASPFKTGVFKILDSKLLEKLLIETSTNSRHITISWHGGEPLLAGIDFFNQYREIITKKTDPSCTITNLIQTNATLITPEYAQFLKENNFVVSISLDGVKGLHDLNRIDYLGRGTFDKVMQGVETLRRIGINPPVICTVTKAGLPYAEENFDFFVKNGFKEIKYSPVYDSNEDAFSISPSQWYDYLHQVFRKWVSLKDPTIRVRDLDEILAYYSKNPLPLCYTGNNCSNWISIDENGDLYPCEYLRSKHCYGNISTTHVIDIFDSSDYLEFRKELEYIADDCKTCELFNMCHNGCPATRLRGSELVFNGKYVYCNTRKRLYTEVGHILSGE